MSPTDEELECIYLKGIARIEQEEPFLVPARREEVKDLKDGLKQAGSYGGEKD